jgi:hypothetical protein
MTSLAGGAFLRSLLVISGRRKCGKRSNLTQNYPNPFNPSTVIHYQLPATTLVTLKLYDVLGKEVAALVNGELNAGYFKTVWMASVPSGLYLYRLQAGEFTQSRRMILLK